MTPKHATPNDEYATDQEVAAAVHALSVADAVRVSRVAKFRAASLAALGLGINGDDLMQEAITRTIKGDRRWRRTVSFVTHLTKTIRSIANHAADELRGGSVVQATSDDPSGRLDGASLVGVLADGERAAAATEQLERIATKFDDDPEVTQVLERLANGLTGPEIQIDLKITQTRYETIMMRLRRGVDRKEGWRP